MTEGAGFPFPADESRKGQSMLLASSRSYHPKRLDQPETNLSLLEWSTAAKPAFLCRQHLERAGLIARLVPDSPMPPQWTARHRSTVISLEQPRPVALPLTSLATLERRGIR